MRRVGVPSTWPVAGAIAFAAAALCATFLVTVLVSNRAQPAVSTGAGTSLVQSASNGKSTLYGLAALAGLGWATDGDVVRVQATSGTVHAQSIFASLNINSFNDAGAYYTALHRIADNAVEMKTITYTAYASVNVSAASEALLILNLPAAFTSEALVVDSENVNQFGTYSGGCTILSNGPPASVPPATSYVLVNSATPTLSVSFFPAATSTNGMSLLCTTTFTVPVPA